MNLARRQQRKRARRWALDSPTVRTPSKPELMRIPRPQTEFGKAVHEMLEKRARASGYSVESVKADYAELEARIAARMREGQQ